MQAHWDSNSIQVILWKLSVDTFFKLCTPLPSSKCQDESQDESNPNVNFLFLFTFISYFLCVLNISVKNYNSVKICRCYRAQLSNLNLISHFLWAFPGESLEQTTSSRTVWLNLPQKIKINGIASNLGHKNLTESREFDTRYLSFLNSGMLLHCESSRETKRSLQG